MSNEKILVPDVGGEEVEIIEICVAVGDALEADEGIVTVETDKASMDIPAPFAGTLLSLSVAVGDKIKEGDVIGEISAGESTSTDEATAVEETAPVEAPVAEPTPAPVAEVAAPAPPVAATTTSSIIEIAVPDIGEDGEVDVIEVLVSVGDTIEEEDGLITLETDKATMDVPSTHAGTVKEVFINVGDKVKQGSVVIKLETSSGVATDTSPTAAPAAPVEAPAKVAPTTAPQLVHPFRIIHKLVQVKKELFIALLLFAVLPVSLVLI